jgi:3-hydroxyisobutyrate dehydrogenase
MAASPETTEVGFVGIGNIGRPMVHALLAAGWRVTVLDRVPQRADELAESGARVAESVADATSSSSPCPTTPPSSRSWRDRTDG